MLNLKTYRVQFQGESENKTMYTKAKDCIEAEGQATLSLLEKFPDFIIKSVLKVTSLKWRYSKWI